MLFISNQKNKTINSYLKKTFIDISKIFGIKSDTEIGLILTNDKGIGALNKKYRGQNKVTDVLSFNIENFTKNKNNLMLGDIYINLDQAKRQATIYNVKLQTEIANLFIHGLLHLMGFDHDPKNLNKWRGASKMIEEKLKITLPSI